MNRNMTSFHTLDESELKAIAPSVFTQEAREGLSERYSPISTIDVVRGLVKEGFMPVKAMQTRVRNIDKRFHTKHMLRFRHVDTQPTKDGLFPELVLVNSHDGTSSYQLMAGLYRLVCSNGLVAGDTYKKVRVRHQGDVVGNVIEGTYEVLDSTQRMIGSAENMSSLILLPEEKNLIAQAAHEIRFDGQGSDVVGIKPEQLLKARRYQEVGKDDLFTTFNVIQENIIRGGLSGYAKDSEGKYSNRSGERFKKVHTREVKSIDQSNTLNRALWTLAEKMAELKAA